MKQLTKDQKQSFETLARQFPEFGRFLADWRQHELESLVFAAPGTMDVIRGRVQALTELQKGIFSRGDTP